jgi:uncharacterized protein
MNNIKGMIIFLSIILLVYLSTNYYIYKRAAQALSIDNPYLLWFRVVFIIIIMSYPLGRILDALYRCQLSYYLTWIGSLWMGAMLYFFIIILFIDELRLVNHFVSFFPNFITKNLVLTGRILFFSILGIVSGVILYGYLNALNIKVKETDIYLDKLDKKFDLFTIVQISDVHLGTIINKDRLENIVSKINEQRPDLVFITGDLVDENVARLEDMDEPLSHIKSRLGVYGVTGNHEYYAGPEEAIKFMRSAGVKVLRNEHVLIDSAFNLIGIEYQFGKKDGEFTQMLDQIFSKADRSLPIIYLKHVPDNLEISQKFGVDLQLSGHTHHGQMFPLTYITDMIYRVSSGYGKIGDFQIFVSDGIGTWGPPLKIGVDAEIVKIRLRSKNQ